MDKKVVLYTIHCPKCKVLEMQLGKYNIPYELCEDIGVMKEKNFMTAPMLEVDGVVYDFNEAIKWVRGIGNNAN